MISSVTEERAAWFDLDENVGREQGSKKGIKPVKKKKTGEGVGIGKQRKKKPKACNAEYGVVLIKRGEREGWDNA